MLNAHKADVPVEVRNQFGRGPFLSVREPASNFIPPDDGAPGPDAAAPAAVACEDAKGGAAWPRR